VTATVDRVGADLEWRRGTLVVATLLIAVWTAGCVQDRPRHSGGFQVVEASIAEIHAAMEAGELTARQLVDAYLARIDVYDRRGPALNSIIIVNPEAVRRADELDQVLAEQGISGVLHGIPVIVKDNFDVAGLPTTAGSLALTDSFPPDDAFQIQRLRAAGAIVLAKSNMAEFAFSPYETVGSRLPGYTRNPYALTRVTAGSSGGTAAAVAASFGAVGLGTDTGNSIRGPSSHQAMVGIRPTMGLTSRDGIVPLNLARDVGGPMARSVADATTVLEVLAGPDPADPVTTTSYGRSRSLRHALRDDALRGARIGVLREMSADSVHSGVLAQFDQAVADLERLGAEVVDPVSIPPPEPRPGVGEPARAVCQRFRFDVNAYLAGLGPEAPHGSLASIVTSGQFHPSVRGRLVAALDVLEPPEAQPGCATQATRAEALRTRVRRVLGDHALDALIYPTWDHPARLIGDLNSPHGDNSQRPAPATGFPAVTVPMGYVDGGLPVGLQLLGDAWSEERLIALAFAYEQGTRHRIPPPTTPPLN